MACLGISCLVGNGLPLRPVPYLLFFLALGLVMWTTAERYRRLQARSAAGPPRR